PGGNITGITRISSQLTAKRLALLKEAVPQIGRIGVFWDPNEPVKVFDFEDTQAAAARLQVELVSLEVRGPDDLEVAFATATQARVDALRTLVSPTTVIRIARILEFEAANRLPAMHDRKAFVEQGGLLGYEPNVDRPRRLAAYLDKILKGTKPADLPVEGPA